MNTDKRVCQKACKKEGPRRNTKKSKMVQEALVYGFYFLALAASSSFLAMRALTLPAARWVPLALRRVS